MNIKKYLAIALAGLLTAGCSKEIPDGSRKVEVQIRVVSQNTTTRAMGDPGDDSGEDLEWDKLVVIFGGTGDEGIVKKFLSYDEYMALNPVNEANPNVKMLPMVVPVGKYRIYGVAYMEKEHSALHTLLNSATKTDDFEHHAIENNPSTADKAYFLTLAADVTPTEEGEYIEVGGEEQRSAHLEVNRLAAKIDVQWDAQDAYENGFTNVRVPDFSFTGPAKGYLFPALNTEAVGAAEPIKFVNTSPISQRNGRQYHYTFLDGVSKPSFSFSISANKDQQSVSGNYTFTFNQTLQRQSWYKINVTIKSVKDGNHTIDPNNP
ncbi:hypothetical protein [uncultured Parabacteroides sp.]|uniref:hypothetical protein n=1 Tax=uncultured Parabacteroides sp. TaxID=512312 RepID=UPI0025871B6F|nr:hypothetical protein [uncultured Parabacteroides sp.]